MRCIIGQLRWIGIEYSDRWRRHGDTKKSKQGLERLACTALEALHEAEYSKVQKVWRFTGKS